ncbi:hypothetical protein TrRE_jg8076 [Triparma retinervis]|uniref:Uncharacterized protein n=1 Tax=Triparma retinervis TaxID=2557542 RepID=A0A9W6ZYW0_9STRA|nr:hypothetical protein TrRE_jg8076 [Triparma retinervis]
MLLRLIVYVALISELCCAFLPQNNYICATRSNHGAKSGSRGDCAALSAKLPGRRSFVGGLVTTSVLPLIYSVPSAEAVGPVKIPLNVVSYSAKPCPKDKPIPGEKAMKGMRGLCVTVEAALGDKSPKDLDKVGVYGFVTDGFTGESVLANNPDLSTDAGQFAMVESVTPSDKSITFEFVAAVPMEKDIEKEENGIGKLNFQSLRVISFPGGQQYGAINPCEMDEFSGECDAWEEENGPYVKADFMIKSNSRTKGR